MIIRQAGDFDRDAIARLHIESWRATYRGTLGDDYLDRDIYAERAAAWEQRFLAPPAGQYIAVAEIDGALAGFICAYGADDARWGTLIDNVHVVQGHKRSGIGAALMMHAAQWCARAYPAHGIYLWVQERNAAAQRFYERLGGANAEDDTWEQPDGGTSRKFRYVWSNPGSLTVQDA
jgi:GNAT superfamily N-acetyltransferase